MLMRLIFEAVTAESLSYIELHFIAIYIMQYIYTCPYYVTLTQISSVQKFMKVSDSVH